MGSGLTRKVSSFITRHWAGHWLGVLLGASAALVGIVDGTIGARPGRKSVASLAPIAESPIDRLRRWC